MSSEFKKQEKIIGKRPRVLAVIGLLLLILGLGVSLFMVVCGITSLYYLFFSKTPPPSIFLFPVTWILNLKPPHGASLPFMSWETAQATKVEPAVRLFIGFLMGVFMSVCFINLIFSIVGNLIGSELKIGINLASLKRRFYFGNGREANREEV